MFVYDLYTAKNGSVDTRIKFQEEQFRAHLKVTEKEPLYANSNRIVVYRADTTGLNRLQTIVTQDTLNAFIEEFPECRNMKLSVDAVLSVDEHIQASGKLKVKVEPKDNSKPVDGNLKSLAALGKPTIDAVPAIAFLALGAAMEDGAKKYGKFNWRETGATVSVFQNAIFRHFSEYFFGGESLAGDSKVHHLAHLMAGCAILLDAELHGVLTDDRKVVVEKSMSELMQRIKQENGG
jgi:hypothetical protein